MKRAKILTSIMLVAVLASLSAQTDIQKVRFGIGAGATSLRMHKVHYLDVNWGFVSSDVDASIQRERSHYGLEGNAFISFYLHKRFRLQSGIGVAYAHSYTTRRMTNHSTFFGIPSTSIEVDKVDQDFVFVEVPLYIRWHLVPEEKKDAGLRPFLDIGCKAQVPIVNKSTYIRTVDDEKFTGKVELDNPISPFFGIGFMVGDKFNLAIDWSRIVQKEFDYSSTVTSIILCMYF